MRDAAAKQPIALQNSSRMIMLTMTVAPASDPTACLKIRIKGAVVAASSSKAVMSLALNRTANNMPSASEPLMMRLNSMERGTSLLAFFTSSDICSCQLLSHEVLISLHGLLNPFRQRLEHCLVSQQRRPMLECSIALSCGKW